MPSITKNNKKNFLHLSKGFTLIEILVVLSIMVALTILVLAGYSETGSRLALERTVESFIGDVNSTKQRSASSLSYEENDEVKKLGHGIYIEEGAGEYIIFKDKSETREFSGGDETVRVGEIETGVSVDSIEVGSDNTPNNLSILFSSENGGVYFNGESGSDVKITFRAQGGEDLTRVVQINSSGVASISYE